MPATAGRVRMPANNRVHSSAALQTHGIWQSAIGYDPYAPDQKQAAAEPGGTSVSASAEQNAYDSFQGLLALARLTGSNADEARGSCKRCGRVGHLTFQCRNFLAVKEEAVAAAAALMERDGGSRKNKGSDGAGSTTSLEEESSEEESESPDSSEDSVMEMAVAAKFGKNFLNTSKSKGHRKERSEATKRKTSSRTRSKRHKSRTKIKGSSTDDSAEHEEKRARKHSKSTRKDKKRHRDTSESNYDDYVSTGKHRKRSKVESDSEVERRRRRRKHSHRKSKRTSKHKYAESDEPSDAEISKHSSKRERHRDVLHD